MDEPNRTGDTCYFLAAGRSLDAIKAHRLAVSEAVEDVQAFVMLCGAERALGGPRISGLHFSGHLPRGWMRNASAPLMAIPDTDTTRGISLLRKMNQLRIPDSAEFALMIGAEAVPSSLHPNSPLITVTWPSYEEVASGWVIKCPVAKDGSHAVPPDATPLTRADYVRLTVSPPFNLLSGDTTGRDAH
jgi:hypothetical protein